MFTSLKYFGVLILLVLLELLFGMLSDSLKIDANNIVLDHGTTLNHTQRNFLSGLNGSLIFRNVELKNPVKGALFTNLSGVAFKNVNIDIRCECENSENQTCTQNDLQCDQIQSIVCNEDDLKNDYELCQGLKEELVSATGVSCLVSIMYVLTKYCQIS